jgi:GrpB-like predicted nucleotidyltransferase (UPF0157 family)
VRVASGEGGQEEVTIGLKRHTVRVVAHRAEWRVLFERELRALQERIGHLVVDIQHVGSTAVFGLDAKPILDIALAVPTTEDVPRLQRPLGEELGYVYRGDAGDGGHLFVKESAPDIRTHHLHVVAVDDPQWREWLLFRDKLRADETLRARYAQLKRALQERFGEDRRGYTEAKNDFIRGLVDPRPQ